MAKPSVEHVLPWYEDLELRYTVALLVVYILKSINIIWMNWSMLCHHDHTVFV